MLSLNWFLFFLIFSLQNVFVIARIYKKSAILGGNITQPNDFRYVVAIISNLSGYVCTGGIIGETFILSAAHCFIEAHNNQFKRDDFSIVAGTNNLELALKNPRSIIIDVEQIIIPAKFSFDLLRSDIALLKLTKKLHVKVQNLKIMKLPSINRYVTAGERAVVAGFGACDIEMSDDEDVKTIKSLSKDGKLRFANVDIVNKIECKAVPYGDFPIEKYHILAKMNKKSDKVYGMCYGDSGSPLVYKSRTVIGVMIDSFDEGCDERNTPAVYTKVHHYYHFIYNTMLGNNEHSRVRCLKSSNRCPLM